MAQFLRPDSNVTQTNWTGGFADIDETTASDADFAYGANNSGTATLEVGLSNPSTPAGGTCTVRWRHAKVSSGTLSGTGGTVTQTCGLYQGTTLITSSTVTTGGTWTDASFTFQVSSITDWTNLRLRWTQSSSGGGGNARGSAVSWAEVETPDAAGAFTLIGDAGSFTLTGQAADTEYGRVVIADSRSYALTGQDAGKIEAYNVAADPVSYTLQGKDAAVFRGYALTAAASSYAATGQAANLLYTRSVTGEKGTYIFTGIDATIRADIRGISDTGAYTLAGQSAELIKGVPVIGGVGQFVADFYPSNLLRTANLSAESGEYILTGNDAGLLVPYKLLTQSVAFDLTGNDSSFRRAYQVAVWLSNTTYVSGYLVRASVLPGTGFIFRALNGGTSSGTEPTWPTQIGNTVVDGSITWKAVSLISGNLQSATPGTIIELFELQLVPALHGSSDIYRFHSGTNATAGHGDVVWAGNNYAAFPVEAEGFEYSGQGTLPRPKIRVSNIFGSITAILLSLPSGIEGAKVTRIRTLARYIDDINFSGGVNPLGAPDPAAEFPREIYFIDRKSTENREIVEFELASAFDLVGVRAPKRQCIANVCQWVYRSTECGYTGTNYFDANDASVGSASLDVCGKRLSSCQVRFGQNAELPYGSFPGIGTASG